MTSQELIIHSQWQSLLKTTTCSLCLWGVDAVEGVPQHVVVGVVELQPMDGLRLIAKHIPALNNWKERK